MEKSKRSTLGLALAAFAVVFILWQLPSDSIFGALLYPIRLLVTFVHETGHGLTAVFTGGRFADFQVFPNGEGVALTGGGNRFLVIQMGYLGAALFGAVLLYLANRVPNTKWVAAGLGVFLMLCALLYSGLGVAFMVVATVPIFIWLLALWGSYWRKRLQFFAVVTTITTLLFAVQNLALVVGLAAGAVLLALSVFASHSVLVFVLNALAFLIGANAFNDIRYLLGNVDGALGNVPNDAAAIANYTGLPAVFWVVLWIVLAAGMLVFAGWQAFKRT